MLAYRYDPDFQALRYGQMLEAVPRLQLDLSQIQVMSEPERLAVAEQMRAWTETLRANPLKGYLPASFKHFDFHQAVHGFDTRLIAGGNRAGKTTTGVVDDIIQVTPMDLLPRHLWQWKRYECPTYIRIFGTDLERQIKTVIHEKFKEWTPKALFKKGSFDESYTSKGETLHLECGCRVDFLSYEVGLNKLGGVPRHRVHYDEEPPKAFRPEGLMRLVDFGGDELFSMTPQMGLTWTYRDVWKHRFKTPDDYEDPEFFRSVWARAIATYDNRNVTESEVKKALAGVTNAQERKQRLAGIFAELGGAIFPKFMSRLVRRFSRERLQGQTIICGIDPGIRWAGLVWVAFDRDNNAVVFAAKKLVNAHAGMYPAEFERVAREWGFDPKRIQYVIDPAGRNRELGTGKSVQSILNELGWHPTPGQNDVHAGLQEVNRRLDVGSLLIGDWLHDLHDEAIEYAWEDREDEVDQVKKRNDHLLDPLRYVCMERPFLPRASKLWIPPGADVARPPAPRRPAGSVMGAMA